MFRSCFLIGWLGTRQKISKRGGGSFRDRLISASQLQSESSHSSRRRGDGVQRAAEKCTLMRGEVADDARHHRGDTLKWTVLLTGHFGGGGLTARSAPPPSL